MAKPEFPQVFLGFFRVLWKMSTFCAIFPALGGSQPYQYRPKRGGRFSSGADAIGWFNSETKGAAARK